MGVRRAWRLMVAPGLLFALTGVAHADSIDGRWCASDGRRLFIDKQVVIIDGSAQASGDYARHHYVFEMPQGAVMGGSTVDIVLISPNTAHVRYVSATGDELNEKPELWTRCLETS